MLIRKLFVDFVRLTNGKFNKEIPEIDPTIKASGARATTVAVAATAVSLQEGTTDVVKQSFPQSADDEFLSLIGSYDNNDPFLAQVANGQASVGGVLSTAVPNNTALTFNGNSYVTITASSVLVYSGDLDLSFSAGIVTVVTTLNHTLATGLSVAITGATQTEYNGTFDIVVLSENSFSYELDAGALTTDSGVYSALYALLNVESLETGSDKNISSGGEMAIDITNIDSVASVGSGGVVGGFDNETTEDYRPRVMEGHDFTPGIATPPGIVFSAKQIRGNTRVFVIRPTGVTSGVVGEAGYKPDLGETVIYLLRDNDPSIIPNSATLTETKNKIISDGNWPTFIPDQFLYLLAPILLMQDFAFTSITPNTVTMQNAIRTQLVGFFEDNAEIEGTISLLDTLNPFLRTIKDPSTGQLLTGFTYTIPPGDMVAGSGEIYTVGDVSFG